METEIDSVRDHYNSNLKAGAYYKLMVDGFEENKRLFTFIMKSIRDIIYSGRFTGTKLLELASAATVHNVAIPSALFTNIVQSDLVLDNCTELRKWLRGESVLDWTLFLELAAEIEGYSDIKKGVSELETRIRSSVKRVVRCDLLSDQIVPLEELADPETSVPYDLILTTLSLSSAAVNYQSYQKALCRIHDLLRTGGGLIICDFVKGAPWQAGGETFNYVQLTIHQVTAALETAGFGKLEFKVMQNEKSEYDYQFESLYCVAAERL